MAKWAKPVQTREAGRGESLMSPLSLVTGIRVARASRALESTGLVLFASCIICGVVRLDGITVRRTATGGLVVTYPARKSRAGRQHAVARLVDAEVRAELEARLIAAARRLGLLDQGPDGRPRRRSHRRDEVEEAEF